MSADNWTECPKCRANLVALMEAAQKRRDKAYGKVPIAEYKKLEKQAEDIAKAPVPDNLREDYQVGIHNGTFSVGYRARCSSCGFEHSFQHEQAI